MRKLLSLAMGMAFILAQAGCQTMETMSEVGTQIAVAQGRITPEQAQSINRSAAAVGKTFDSITPEQEYYIGRSVAATILTTYKPYDNSQATEYLNTMGQALAMFSDRPETYGGYHFLILDTPEINAFSAPGGLIMVSRGLLRCCKSEDAVAAVLAHEIGHVENRHGLQAINKDRVTSALRILAVESAKNMGGQNLAELTRNFEGSINDITSTLVNSGYSRKLEAEADAASAKILQRIGYDPHALVAMLNEMARRMPAQSAGFGRTHPAPRDRIASVQGLISSAPAAPAPAERQARFQKALGDI